MNFMKLYKIIFFTGLFYWTYPENINITVTEIISDLNDSNTTTLNIGTISDLNSLNTTTLNIGTISDLNSLNTTTLNIGTISDLNNLNTTTLDMETNFDLNTTTLDMETNFELNDSNTTTLNIGTISDLNNLNTTTLNIGTISDLNNLNTTTLDMGTISDLKNLNTTTLDMGTTSIPQNRSSSILYEFGNEAGDNIMPKFLDFSIGPLNLSKNFKYFGLNLSELYINSNGLLSFFQPIHNYIPIEFPVVGFVCITPFWNDIDTTKGGDIYYREINDTLLLNDISVDISNTVEYFNATWAYLVTWYDVASFETSNLRNTFQVLITTDGYKSYSIFNYDKLEWSTMYDTVNAQAGFNFGDGFRHLTLPGSRTIDVLNYTQNSNIGVSGRWIYRIDDLNTTTCLLKPYINFKFSYYYNYYSIGGEDVIISGLCINETDQYLIRLDNLLFVECKFLNTSNCFFKTPFFNKTGFISIEMFINDNNYFLGYIYVIETSFGFYYKQLLNIEPIYDFSSGEVFFKLNTILNEFYSNYKLYLIKIEEKSIIKSLIEKDSDGIYKINSSTIYKNSSRADVEIIYFGLVKSFNQFFKYDSIQPVIITNKFENSDQICRSWHSKQPDPSPISNLVPSCPPNIFLNEQNFFLFDFEWDFCNPFNPKMCQYFNPGAYVCYKSLISVQAGSFNASQQCCYNQNGNLLVGPPGGGSLRLQNSGQNEIEHIKVDIFPYIRCCILSNNCDLFYEKRPSDNGSLWRPPVFGGGAGDPHFTTFDGLEYTFNGYGEYILFEIKEINLRVNVQLEPIIAENGNKTRGTVFTGIAIKGNELDDIEIKIENRDLLIKINGKDQKIFGTGNSTLRSDNYILSFDNNKLIVYLIYENGIEFEIHSISLNKALFILSFIPSKFNGKLRGLMGNNNGDRTDDFILPNDTVLSINPNNDRDVFQKFGQKWLVSNEMSFFKSSMNHDNKKNVIFEPKFIQDGIIFENEGQEKKAKELCGENKFCLFDYSITGNEDIAKSNIELKELILSKYPPQSSVSFSDQTRTTTWNAAVIDKNRFKILIFVSFYIFFLLN